MLSAKENYLAMLNHQSYDYIPDMALDVSMAGGAFETWENGPLGGGYDEFGLKWICTKSANGQAVPDPSCHPVPDIEDWKSTLKFPDLSKIDWETYAASQLSNVRPDTPVVYGTWNSIFLRFSHQLGFENALIAMYEEPEACKDMMQAITDYKCRLVEYVAKYIKPDIITNYDDVCTERGPFMSPEPYRDMIKPFHKQFNDCVRSFGILPSQHCCGFAEELIPDFIDEGAVSWEAAQPTNDLVKVLKEYGDRICVIGGYDTNGPAGQINVSDEVIQAEVNRMMKEYGSLRSFGTMGFILSDDPDPMAFVNNMIRISMKVAEQRNNYKFPL